MAQYKKPFFASLMLLILGYAAVMFLLADAMQIQATMADFKNLCTSDPKLGYSIFAATLCIALFSGLPIATLIMLLAGIIFSFWEAALLVTACRAGVAMSSFKLARSYFNPQDGFAKKPLLIQKFEDHPNIALLLMRLSPLPDSVVNYTMGAAPVKAKEYALISLIGMMPATLFIIWTGNSLGNLSNLINYIN